MKVFCSFYVCIPYVTKCVSALWKPKTRGKDRTREGTQKPSALATIC